MNTISSLTTCPHYQVSIAKYGLNIPIDPSLPLICIVCLESKPKIRYIPRPWPRYHEVECSHCRKKQIRAVNIKKALCEECRIKMKKPKREKIARAKGQRALCKNDCKMMRLEGSAFCSDKCRREDHQRAQMYYQNKGY